MVPRATTKGKPNCKTGTTNKNYLKHFRLIQDSERYCPNRQIY